MDLTPYVDGIHRQVAVAADSAGEDARAVAERLIAPLDSAVRLALLDVLSAAADEITRELAPGSVHVRLRGGEPDFVVTPPPFDDDADVTVATAAVAGPSVAEGDEGATMRINLRVPEHLKVKIEAAAERAAMSVNGWLVRVAGAAVRTDIHDVDRDPDRRVGRRDSWGRQRHTGWVR